MDTNRKMNGKVMTMECDESEGMDFPKGLAASIRRACVKFNESRGIERKSNFFNMRARRAK